MPKVWHTNSVMSLIYCKKPDLRLVSIEGDCVMSWSLLLSLVSKRMSVLLMNTLQDEGTYCLYLPLMFNKVKQVQQALLQLDLEFFRDKSELESIFGIIKGEDLLKQYSTNNRVMKRGRSSGIDCDRDALLSQEKIKWDSEYTDLSDQIKLEPVEMNCEPENNILQLNVSVLKNEYGIFSCEQCSYTSKHRSNLTRHIKTIHEGALYECDQCQFASTTRSNLNKHKQYTHECARENDVLKGEKVELKCDPEDVLNSDLKKECKEEETYEDIVTNGSTGTLTEPGSARQYNCDQCAFHSAYHSSLKQHIRSIHDGVSYCCEQCGLKATTLNNLKQHVRIVHEHIQYYCDQCGYNTKTKSNLKRHHRMIHEGVKYECDECGIKASTKSDLRRHKQTIHEGIKFYCEECDFKTTRMNYLKQHKQTVHEGLEYKCDLCPYKAKFHALLQQHKRSIHEGIKYLCELCDYQASTRGILKQHNRVVHEGFRYNCDQCEYQTTQSGNLHKHKRSIHDDDKFMCFQCDYKATTKGRLRNHVNCKHDKQ